MQVRGDVFVTCAPAFELGEMAASEIQLRCYPVRVIMQSSSDNLANPERDLSGGMGLNRELGR